MAAIHGLREQILANFDHLGFSVPASRVDIIVPKARSGFYEACIREKSKRHNLIHVRKSARSVTEALEQLLEYTCKTLGREDQDEQAPNGHAIIADATRSNKRRVEALEDDNQENAAGPSRRRRTSHGPTESRDHETPANGTVVQSVAAADAPTTISRQELAEYANRVFLCVFNSLLNTPAMSEGLHEQDIALRTGLTIVQVHSAALKLEAERRIYPTVDHETWAPLEI